MNKVQCLVKYA